MIFVYLIAAGVGIIILNYLARVGYTRLIKPLPSAAVRLGKAWGETTDRHSILRGLNTFFYLLGMATTLAGIIFGVYTLTQRTIPDPPATEVVRPYDENLRASEILDLVNVQREAEGLNRLVEDRRLTAIAQVRADDMSGNEYYAHRSPEGLYYYDFFPEFGINADYSCENLNVEFTVDENRYVQDWLASNKGHRECMLNEDITSAGYAVTTFGDSSTSEVYLVVAIHTTPIQDIEPTPPRN